MPHLTVVQGGEGIIWAFVLAHTHVTSSLKASNVAYSSIPPCTLIANNYLLNECMNLIQEVAYAETKGMLIIFSCQQVEELANSGGREK